jgi:hypothetical protein
MASKYDSDTKTFVAETEDEIKIISEELAVQLVSAPVSINSTLDSQAAIVERMAYNFPQINLDRKMLIIREDTKLFAKQCFISRKEVNVESQSFHQPPPLTETSSSMDIMLRKSVQSRISRQRKGQNFQKFFSTMLGKDLSSLNQSDALWWGRRILMPILLMYTVKSVVFGNELVAMYQRRYNPSYKQLLHSRRNISRETWPCWRYRMSLILNIGYSTLTTLAGR